jgi:16S rRNA G1207 methylase RsmC
MNASQRSSESIKILVQGPKKVNLKRYPFRKNDLLQAWDAADELIIEHLGGIELKNQRVLVVQDQFGALSCSLKTRPGPVDLTSYTDSYISSKGIELNIQHNGQLNRQGQAEQIYQIHDLSHLTGQYNLVLMRIPKNMSFFEDILCHLTKHLHANSQIICGYMVKHQANAAFDLLNKYIGETRTSLAKKKARLIFSTFQKVATESPYPLKVSIEGFEKPFVHHSGIFSREKLDIGTRFFLENIPHEDHKTILDLGCANGIIGIAAKRANPSAKVIFADESQMAILSAKENYRTYFPNDPLNTPDSANFIWTNCFENGEPGSVDLVLCNPPFHQGTTVGDFVAKQMFADAFRSLVPGGMLRVIGNTHLRYPSELRKIFGNSEIVASNSKFTIVDAIKP